MCQGVNTQCGSDRFGTFLPSYLVVTSLDIGDLMPVAITSQKSA